MKTSSTSRRFTAEQRLLLAAHMARDLPGDHQMMDDDTLLQVLKGELRLSPEQYDAMVASPLTLCRLRFLESCRLAQQSQATAPASLQTLDAAHWQRSEGLLKAAASDERNFTLGSTDGLWALHSFITGGATRVMLELCRPEDEDAPALQFDPGMEWAVLDGSGATLLLGKLDRDGELEALWDRPIDLRSHLAQFGGVWKVERV